MTRVPLFPHAAHRKGKRIRRARRTSPRKKVKKHKSARPGETPSLGTRPLGLPDWSTCCYPWTTTPTLSAAETTRRRDTHHLRCPLEGPRPTRGVARPHTGRPQDQPIADDVTGSSVTRHLAASPLRPRPSQGHQGNPTQQTPAIQAAAPGTWLPGHHRMALTRQPLMYQTDPGDGRRGPESERLRNGCSGSSRAGPYAMPTGGRLPAPAGGYKAVRLWRGPPPQEPRPRGAAPAPDESNQYATAAATTTKRSGPGHAGPSGPRKRVRGMAAPRGDRAPRHRCWDGKSASSGATSSGAASGGTTGSGAASGGTTGSGAASREDDGWHSEQRCCGGGRQRQQGGGGGAPGDGDRLLGHS
ncbi:uncharacterized protein [Dermacentor andersoni]|uniref:uncharacterized protein n=1 Tax=Dermacentor andersoni TaxID=34620 RepID=UPI003B3B1E9B